MFDVAWGDTAGETVAQRRQRKEREQQKTAQGTKRSSIHSAASSSGSSKAQSGSRVPLFGIFGSSKKSRNNSMPTKVEDLTSLPSRLSSHDELPNSQERKANIAIPGEDGVQAGDVQDRYSSLDAIQYSPISNAESTFSRWPGRSIATESSLSSMTDNGLRSHDKRPLSTGSFVIMSRNDMEPSRDNVADLNTSLGKISVTADRADVIDPCYVSDLSLFPNVPTQETGSLRNDSQSDEQLQSLQAETSTTLGILESWKPSPNWEPASHDREPKSSTQSTSRTNSRTQKPRARQSRKSEMSHMQRHIRRMEAASPKIILERLREQWTDVADANVYKELEFEKQLWMLTGFKFLAPKAGGTGSKANDRDLQVSTPAQAKPTSIILSLYENQACASFLATYSPANEVHSLTTSSPVSPIAISHIRPATATKSHAILPYASSVFTSIHSSSLPATLPSPSIPSLLRECHRVLIPNGTLHLTLMDPRPPSSCTGLHLRRWLDKHLLLNLETQFRCSKPSRLFPIWLHDAGFACAAKSAGTKVSKLRFWAVGRGEGGFVDPADGDAAAKELSQLNAVVGRMLWRELWGNYVVGDKWWWEDDQVVEECASMGTRWDCLILEVVKRGD
ncbi:MAG: hypothetical protein M1818_003530 [Claussenomyces sp. TS43310]|nr:MAG: hypothetical protein M1818_003530 [Claussenomyces sp. TS43310]